MLLLNHEVISTLFAPLNSSTSFRTLPDSSPLLLLSVPFGHPAHPLVTPLHELNDTPVLLPTSLTLRTQFSQFTLLTYLHSLFFHYSLSTPRTPFLLLPFLFLWLPISSLSFQFLHLLYSCYLLSSMYSLDCLYSSSLSLYPMIPLPPCTSFTSLTLFTSFIPLPLRENQRNQES